MPTMRLGITRRVGGINIIAGLRPDPSSEASPGLGLIAKFQADACFIIECPGIAGVRQDRPWRQAQAVVYAEGRGVIGAELHRTGLARRPLPAGRQRIKK